MTGIWLEDHFYLGKDFAHTVMRTLRGGLDGKEAKDIPLQVAGN